MYQGLLHLHNLLRWIILILLLLGAWTGYMRRDPSHAIVGALIIVTTPLLLIYLNLAYGPTQHVESGSTVVREGAERDYFFVWIHR